jgi:hypothetical protein
MNSHRDAARLVCFILLLSLGVCIPTVYAAPLTLTLTVINGPNNVTDAAGLWQFDGGEVQLGQTLIGYYARTKRVVTGGTTVQNTAAVTITIFVLGSTPPDNVTLQGAHSFDTGEQSGSVSAASTAFAGLIGITFQATTTSLILDLP